MIFNLIVSRDCENISTTKFSRFTVEVFQMVISPCEHYILEGRYQQIVLALLCPKTSVAPTKCHDTLWCLLKLVHHGPLLSQRRPTSLTLELALILISILSQFMNGALLNT